MKTSAQFVLFIYLLFIFTSKCRIVFRSKCRTTTTTTTTETTTTTTTTTTTKVIHCSGVNL